MKSRLCLPIRSGIVFAVMATQLGANWSITSPENLETFSTNSDVPVAGFGPVSTTATVNLVRLSSGFIQDAFIITTNDEEASFGGEFDIDASWPTGVHSIEIFVNGDRVYGAGLLGVDVLFQENE